jgi:phage tail sheath gpL-like
MSIPPSAIARVIGIETLYENPNLGQALYLPQRIAIVGQGNTLSSYSTDKQLINSEKEAAELYGYGSPLHLVCRQLLPSSGLGLQGIPVTAYPLLDDGAGVAATGNINTTLGPASYSMSGYIYIGGIRSDIIVIQKDDDDATVTGKIKAAIDAVLEMPVTTGAIVTASFPITAKWKGASGNEVTIDFSELLHDDFTFVFPAKLSGGLANPDVQDALDLINDVWETIILNCLNYYDTTALETYSIFGESRWNQLVKKPLLVASGAVEDFTSRTNITNLAASKLDRTNFLVVSVGSRELPCVIAAQGLVNDIAQKANDKPAHNYIGVLKGLHAGSDDLQENYIIRNNAIKLGSSTNVKIGDLAALSDTITFYHPDGETPPAYRYVVDVIKLQNIIFNLDVIQETFRGRPLLPDDTPTTDPDAVQPKGVKTILSVLADNLANGRSAIIVEPEYTKKNMIVEISNINPKRLDTEFPVKLSGNTEVNSTVLKFSFYFGQ